MKNPTLDKHILTQIQLTNATEHDLKTLDKAMLSEAFIPCSTQNLGIYNAIYTKSGTMNEISNTAYRIVKSIGKRFQLNIYLIQ